MDSLLKPYAHNDENESAEIFLEKFLSLQKIYKWSNKEAALCFPLYLVKGPLSWYQTVDQNVKENFETLKEDFLSNFDKTKNNLYEKLILLNRKQKPSETIDSFLSDFYKVLNFSKFEEHIKILFFVNNLQKEFQEFVISSRPKNLLDAIQSAKLIESKHKYEKAEISSNNDAIIENPPKLLQNIRSHPSHPVQNTYKNSCLRKSNTSKTSNIVNTFDRNTLLLKTNKITGNTQGYQTQNTGDKNFSVNSTTPKERKVKHKNGPIEQEITTKEILKPIYYKTNTQVANTPILAYLFLSMLNSKNYKNISQYFQNYQPITPKIPFPNFTLRPLNFISVKK